MAGIIVEFLSSEMKWLPEEGKYDSLQFGYKVAITDYRGPPEAEMGPRMQEVIVRLSRAQETSWNLFRGDPRLEKVLLQFAFQTVQREALRGMLLLEIHLRLTVKDGQANLPHAADKTQVNFDEPIEVATSGAFGFSRPGARKSADLEKDFSVALDKGKVGTGIFLIVLFTVLAILGFSWAIKASGIYLFFSVLLAPFLFAVSLVTLIISIRRLSGQTGPGLIIGPNGIAANFSPFPAGPISWRNISRIYMTTQSTRGGEGEAKLLIVELAQGFSEEYYAGGNWLTRVFKRINAPFSKTSLGLTNAELDIELDELFGIVEQYYEKYGGV